MSRWQFWIDVGGTFTDCVAQPPSSISPGELRQHKTLSSGVIKGLAESVESDPASRTISIVDSRRRHDPDGVWNGLRFRCECGETTVERFEDGVLHLAAAAEFSSSERIANYEILCDEPAPIIAIRYLLGKSSTDPLPPVDVRLGTTRGTNALLTRSGSSTAFVTSRGFRDILRIGFQSRPQLFALAIEKPDELYQEVVEVDQRIDAVGQVIRELDAASVRLQLGELKERFIESLAVALPHACSNPAHENLIESLAKDLGFRNVSLSHQISSLRKLVPRGDTTVIDAYLNPVLGDYIQAIKTTLHADSTLELMTSSGGLASADHFRGKDSILSGPAGGVVGVANVATQAGFASAIGFDMGGTSTDVARWSGELELEYESEKAGVRVATPMVAIETVAAGGGSLCRFDGVKLTVGPESAGADPGPACYGRNGPLAVTDINFFLGKIPVEAFPFELDRDAVEQLLLEQCRQIGSSVGTTYTPVELATGYLRIANTNMAEAIRCISVERGIDPRDDLLVAFGGAAAQHACAVAAELGMSKVLLHPSAGVMSALGIGLAEITVHQEVGVYEGFHVFKERLDDVFRTMTKKSVTEFLASCDDVNAAHSVTQSLDLRFTGLDEPIRVSRPANDDFQLAYEEEFRRRCGYVPENRQLEVVTARVTVAGSTIEKKSQSQIVENKDRPTALGTQVVYFGGTASATSVFQRSTLAAGQKIIGPAIITEAISTIVIDPGWHAVVLSDGELLLTRPAQDNVESSLVVDTASDTNEPDPTVLEVFHKRFAAIATQMGTTLRKNSRSVNVKERLDYSCAIFTAKGELVVNAPHIPVHLGAMGATVRYVLETLDLQAGDVAITNDPYHGGSHLPDVTVITPVYGESNNGADELLFFTASRAHHAEIGGISPGSMPAFSTNLAEEGVLIRATKVVSRGRPQIEMLRTTLTDSLYPSRDPDLNVADVMAQIAANRQGANELLKFVSASSWSYVSKYMQFIQSAAEKKTRLALSKLPDGERQFVDHLDDGTPISVKLTIQGDSAIIDFSGTGAVLPGNLNANRAITTAATLYCLRLLVDEDIPLNEGVLKPIDFVLPVCLLNPSPHDDPKQCPAVVGGNVETSQRIVDVILGAFGIAAASQGTMNNLLFGNDTFGYYETICGGGGATALGPGADAVHTHMTNTRLTDLEVLESRFPVRLERFQVREGSGGEGKHRGGDGIIREIEFLDSLQVSLLTQRRGEFAPYGIEGGQDGHIGENVLMRADGRVLILDGITALSVQPGDRIRISTPGGGAWGNNVVARSADPTLDCGETSEL